MIRLLLILLFVNIAFSKDLTIIIDRSVPQDVSVDVLKSVIDLNKRVGKNNISFVNGVFTYKVFISYKPKQTETIAGEAYKKLLHCQINLYPNSLYMLKTTVWHEIGHCAGLSHNGNHGEIMSKFVDPFPSYSAEKIETFLNDLRGALE